MLAPVFPPFILAPGSTFWLPAVGLKPAFSIEDHSLRDAFQRNRDQRFRILPARLFHFVYDPALVTEVMQRHTDIFPDYSPKKQILDEYIRRVIDAPLSPTSQLQLGILVGYPRNAVIQHAKNSDIFDIFSYTTQTYGQALTSAEQEMRLRYRKGFKDIKGGTMEEFTGSVNRYRSEHQEALRLLIEKVFPGQTIPAESKRYLLTARFIDLPGFKYDLGNPVASDYDFAQRVRDTFDQSGMNMFLSSVEPEH